MFGLKRIYTAIVLLIVVAILCTAEYTCVKHSSDEFIMKLESIEEAVRNGDVATARAQAERINDDWRETASTVDMLLYHDYVDEISAELAVLPAYIGSDEDAELFATCKRAKKRLTSLKESEKPTPENII